MKYKTTQKAIKNSYSRILCVGYCDLQYLFYFESPEAYTCGVYEWNADIYSAGGVAIVTGYRPFGNIRPSYDLRKAYDDRAREVVSNMNYQSIEETRGILREMIRDFIGDALREVA